MSPILHHQQQLRKIGFSTHHLPTKPISNKSPSLEFQHLSNRLTFWNNLHSYRNGTEYLFQNYFRESSVGPEILWALPPLQIDQLETNDLDALGFEPIKNCVKRKPIIQEEEEEEELSSSLDEIMTPNLICSSSSIGVVGRVENEFDDDGHQLILVKLFKSCASASSDQHHLCCLNHSNQNQNQILVIKNKDQFKKRKI
ncbi:hypothetical protein CROQUDRAFT_656745 [Cronartium quercuum f. sp. fusiforme G11]|uniref:Uncharacterized protein n=1 Tax=Cronartium quercuum f. sp. fusiforme G11 TaxID=708437 RepID=A0A9P6NH96_9BASI|nr:hypothetical protein CROQUDRAFT_656745 [Cronartium quercuum f. sp. fusiforme G11]